MLNVIVAFLETLPYGLLAFTLWYNKRKYNRYVEYNAVTWLSIASCLLAIALYTLYP